MNSLKKNNLSIFLSIIFAGIIIILASFFRPETEEGIKKTIKIKPNKNNIKMVTEDDHIMGNPNAPLKLIEFSDTECAFCKKFHPEMTRVMEGELGKSGKVAWVYRHFPVDDIHSKARIEAEATECAEELGGQDKFWEYLDRLFVITPSNNDLDLKELPNIAEYVGLDRKKFNTCLKEEKYQEKIESQYQDGIASGVVGTPYSIIVTNKGEKFVIPGAYPYKRIKATLQAILDGKMPGQKR